MTKTLDQIDAEVLDVVSAIRPLQIRLEALRMERAKLASRNWIAANGVKREDVETVDGEGKPYFGIAYKFIEWLKANSTKRFCEWNGRIYYTSEMITGRMNLDSSPAFLDDVPERKP